MSKSILSTLDSENEYMNNEMTENNETMHYRNESIIIKTAVTIEDELNNLYHKYETSDLKNGLRDATIFCEKLYVSFESLSDQHKKVYYDSLIIFLLFYNYATTEFYDYLELSYNGNSFADIVLSKYYKLAHANFDTLAYTHKKYERNAEKMQGVIEFYDAKKIQTNNPFNVIDAIDKSIHKFNDDDELVLKKSIESNSPQGYYDLLNLYLIRYRYTEMIEYHKRLIKTYTQNVYFYEYFANLFENANYKEQIAKCNEIQQYDALEFT